MWSIDVDHSLSLWRVDVSETKMLIKNICAEKARNWNPESVIGTVTRLRAV
jgi:hypothetical protein